jgi:UDP-3-O-[3-hydroxymyristoyl] glucosamine N-acyltransferase
VVAASARRTATPAAGTGRLNRMLIEHRGAAPDVHPSAYVAPTAVLCGAVRIGPEARILFGAVLTAEDGEIGVGARCVVMENAVLRGRARHPLVIGNDVLIGPHAHLNGARVGDGCFLATGAALFPGSELGPGSEVRIRGSPRRRPGQHRPARRQHGPDRLGRGREPGPDLPARPA